jgi:uncharacterized repeat protein (TIGR03803 family)
MPTAAGFHRYPTPLIHSQRALFPESIAPTAASTLYSFTGGADGGFPLAGAIRDSAGNFYGTTARGGDFSSSCAFYGCGVVFKVDKDGKETVLHAFTDGVPQSGLPQPGVIRDESGNLYGTFPYNSGDRCRAECGLVFKITPGG